MLAIDSSPEGIARLRARVQKVKGPPRPPVPKSVFRNLTQSRYLREFRADAEAGRLRVWIDRWSVEASSSPHEHHRLLAAGDGFSLDLTVTPEKRPVAVS